MTSPSNSTSAASTSRMSIPPPIPTDSSLQSAMIAYRSHRDSNRKLVLQTYTILGFLSSGTYGRVYKARLKSPPNSTTDSNPNTPNSSSSIINNNSNPSSLSNESKEKRDITKKGSSFQEKEKEKEKGKEKPPLQENQVFAIKKFKPDKETEVPQTYTGISQSAMREIALNRELSHENIVTLREVMLEDKSIYMVFEFAEHDFLQLIHHHGTALRTSIQPGVLKSLLWQLLNGVSYLHSNWVLHRDLKPANILITSSGVVKIGDLGLARLYSSPLQPLYSGDKVVVTIWYRSPELLLGARHYTPAIDMWAVGCIWGELLALRPMFKGEEAKMDPKTKTIPFQTDQLTRICEVLGSPTREQWPAIDTMPDYKGWWPHLRIDNWPNRLYPWYTSHAQSSSGFGLFQDLLHYDPAKRFTAAQALEHPWFSEDPKPSMNAFSSLTHPSSTYPTRRVIQDETDPKMSSVAAVAAAAPLPAPSSGPNSVSGYNYNPSSNSQSQGTNQSQSQTRGGHLHQTALTNAASQSGNKRQKRG